MKNEKILIDTNVLIYAFSNREKAKQVRSQAILKKGISQNVDLCFSIQNFSEFARIMTEKSGIPEQEVAQIITDLETIAYATYYVFPEIVQKALEIKKATGIHY